MILAPKHIHKLRKELARISDSKAAVRICEYAGFQTAKIYFDVDLWSIWGNILGKANTSQEKFIRLLGSALREHPSNPVIEIYLSELTQKRATKIATIANALKIGDCVLFLGPDVLRVSSVQRTISFNKYLCDLLVSEMRDNLVYYDRNLTENLSYLAQCYSDIPMYVPGDIARISATKFEYLSKRKLVDEDFYALLSDLPFPLVINSNADQLLLKQLEQKNPKQNYFEYYDTSNSQTVTKAPSPDTIRPENAKSIIYNIFGSFENPFSVLYTEAQFLDFINKVIQGNPRMALGVLNEIYKKQTYIFLGFDFEQWYFKMIFHLFRMKKEQYHAISCNFEEDIGHEEEVAVRPARLSNVTKEFFEEEFRIYFVNDDVRNFIVDLKEKYNQL